MNIPTSLRKPLACTLPLLCYLAVALPAGVASMERLNSDGVCYLHRAMLLASGDVHDAVSAYWSPGLIVSTVPLLKLGVDPLHAIHWTLVAWGIVYGAGAVAFFGASGVGVGAACVVGLVAARLVTPTITPDVLLGAAMLFYLAALRRQWWLAAGLIAGVGFLGKAYFLPVFVVQLPVTLAWFRVGWRRWLSGIIGFAVVAVPWIAIISVHEGHLTFSTAGRRNRFVQDVAPVDIRAHVPDVSSVPPDPFFSNMEVTDHDAWPAWSPLSSAARFRHQFSIAVEHLKEMIVDIWRFDFVGLTLIGVIAAFAVGNAQTRWLAASGCIYAGGFLLVAYETRYILPVLLPIGIFICLEMVKVVRWRPNVLAAIVLLAFAVSAGIEDYDLLVERQPNISAREIAERLRDADLGQRFATNTANRDRAACVAFFLKQKFIAMPYDRSAAVLQSKLDARGIDIFLHWVDPLYPHGDEWPEPQTRVLLGDGKWSKKMAIHLDSKRRLDVYKHVATSGSPSASGAVFQ